MNPNKSEIVIILDRSGSMSSIKADVEGGFKSFLAKQQAEPGECAVSLFQFDEHYEAVFENRPIKDVNEIKVEPRGSTALLDAIGKTVNAVGQRLDKTPEADRPGLVIVYIITDGQENSSKEYVKSKIAEIIKHQTDVYKWRFMFLGCNFDAVQAGASFGNAIGSSLSYAPTADGIANTFNVMAASGGLMRAASAAGLDTSYSFSDADRLAAMGKAPVTIP